MTATSPSLRQRKLGTRLRKLRTDLDLTVEDVGEKLLCSATKISRIETATRRPSLRDVRDLCRLYNVSEAETAELMDLARMAREQGWWTQYGDLQLDPYIGLEQVATSITSYTMYYFPGLLQTADYAEAIIKAIAPKMDPVVHKERVEARLLRQQLLDRENPPRYRVLLDEAVLHHRVGGSAVMFAHLDNVLRLERNGKTTVQVLPFDSAHAAQDGNFVLLEFQELRPFVFVECLTTDLYMERDSDMDRYREAVEYLRDEALNPRDSVALIAGVQKNYAESKKGL